MEDRAWYRKKSDVVGAITIWSKTQGITANEAIIAMTRAIAT